METVGVIVNKDKLRDYQEDVFDAICNKGCKNVLAIWPRRAGKDLTAWNICINELIKKRITIYYMFPTYIIARRGFWKNIFENELELIEEHVEHACDKSMSIKFTNGSLFRVLAGKEFNNIEEDDSPKGIVFSELAFSGYEQYVIMSELENTNWKLIVSTPCGKFVDKQKRIWNILYTLYNAAMKNSNWYISKLTIEDTKHISLKQAKEGGISDKFQRQEFFTEFNDV